MITGLKTLSSKMTCEPAKSTAAEAPCTCTHNIACEQANQTAAVAPCTCTHTIVMASHCVGLTLPGMIDEPGSFSGMESSPRPERGPEPSRRISFAILNRPVATELIAPCTKT